MIDTSIAKLTTVFIHQVGDNEDPQKLTLSHQPVFIYDEVIKTQLLNYFKNIYNEYEWFSFIGDVNKPNPMYELSQSIFKENEEMHLGKTHEIAELLASKSVNQKINSGQLIIAKIEELIVHDEIVNAIAIVKSESLQHFIKTTINDGIAEIKIDQGIYVKKIDKGCLIIETQEQDGYRLCIKDSVSKGDAAIFWKTDFLNAGIKMDDYQYTQVYMQATDKFLNEYDKTEGNLNKEKEITYKNRSAEYFNDSQEFSWDEYKEAVFQEPEMQEAFDQYKEKLPEQVKQNVPDSFQVSENAVKNNSKYFRSVIKLDKNFSLYVHGNRNMIEKGVDENGRKYYKLYFEEEK